MVQDPIVLDSITRMDDSYRGKVLVAASHGGVYAAYLAALGKLRGVILNDAGGGRDNAGIGGLAYLDRAGMAAATTSHLTARIGDGADMMDRGIISHVNEHARAVGCEPGMSCAECAAQLADAPPLDDDAPPVEEARFLLRSEPGEPEVWGIDSNSLVSPEDKDRILVTGSHGQLLGNKPETAIKYDVIAAVYNDAGCGIDGAGTSRLPALDTRGIAAATVSHMSARIGEAHSTYEDGVITHVNQTAAAAGVTPGMTVEQFVVRVAAKRRKT